MKGGDLQHTYLRSYIQSLTVRFARAFSTPAPLPPCLHHSRKVACEYDQPRARGWATKWDMEVDQKREGLTAHRAQYQTHRAHTHPRTHTAERGNTRWTVIPGAMLAAVPMAAPLARCESCPCRTYRLSLSPWRDRQMSNPLSLISRRAPLRNRRPTSTASSDQVIYPISPGSSLQECARQPMHFTCGARTARP